MIPESESHALVSPPDKNAQRPGEERPACLPSAHLASGHAAHLSTARFSFSPFYFSRPRLWAGWIWDANHQVCAAFTLSKRSQRKIQKPSLFGESVGLRETAELCSSIRSAPIEHPLSLSGHILTPHTGPTTFGHGAQRLPGKCARRPIVTVEDPGAFKAPWRHGKHFAECPSRPSRNGRARRTLLGYEPDSFQAPGIPHGPVRDTPSLFLESAVRQTSPLEAVRNAPSENFSDILLSGMGESIATSTRSNFSVFRSQRPSNQRARG